jgi:branched-chain amino acid transport system ATP-binding protein
MSGAVDIDRPVPADVSGLAAPLLRVRSVRWTVGGFEILRNIDLDVRPGEILSIIGPNGAGKSSLMNVVSGAVRPTSGTLEFRGSDITRLPPHARSQAGIGRTFQSAHVFRTLTAIENCRIAAQSHLSKAGSVWRRPKDDDDATQRATRALAAVGLDRSARVVAGDLSHGNRRLLEFAMVLVTEPQLLLLDEPCAGVAVEHVPELIRLIGAARDTGTTVVFVEHHMEFVAELSDRIAVLYDGAVLLVDEPTAVLSDAKVNEAYLGVTA